ncbi:MAG TPA: carboxypeptidase regulatory-like domain-containing protein [Gemmatimonadales bacterium]
MLHADDGTLHAYLDGELSALEVARLEAHLAECAPCRARLDEERDVVARSSRILALAEPPERAAPPLHQLRHPRLAWRLRVPLAWAASAAVLLVSGWLVIGTIGSRQAAPLSEVPQSGVLALKAERDSPAPDAARPAELERASVVTSVSTDSLVQIAAKAPAVAAPRTADSAAAGLPQGQLFAERARADSVSTVREVRALADAQPSPAPAAPIAPQSAAEFDVDSARALLGGEIHAIDGVAILALRRAPGAAVVVEQEVAPGVVIQLRQETERAGRVAVSAREGPAQIVGRVTDATSGAAMPNAYVAIRGTSLGAITSARGTYVIDSVPPGSYALGVRVIGYEPLELAAARVDSGRTTVADFGMRQSAVELGAVVVTGEESRRRDAAAPAANAGPTSDLVRRVGRLRIGISGPLPPDSLATLLEKVRPVP